MVRALNPLMNDRRPIATLEPVRFGEFLLMRHRITDEQWLAALAEHWSATATKRRPIGSTIVAAGFLDRDEVEAEARAFHDDLDVIEVLDATPRPERVTVPLQPQRV